MGFEQFSLSLSNTKVGEKFMESLKEGIIPGTKCNECGKKFYPPRHNCQNCGSSDMDWIELSTTGELLAFTSINVPGEHYQNFTLLNQDEHEPIPIGIISLKEEGVNLLGWMPELRVGDIEVGMELKASVEVVEAKRLPIALIRKVGLAPDVNIENFQLKVPEDFEKDSLPNKYYTIVFKKA